MNFLMNILLCRFGVRSPSFLSAGRSSWKTSVWHGRRLHFWTQMNERPVGDLVNYFRNLNTT